MDMLLAFLAFSAVMIVLSTMATAIVEALHKVLKQRKSDFELMLSSYYEGTIQPLIKDSTEDSVEKFVDDIRRNPVFVGAENKGFTKFFFDTSFESLSTPQFIEQLARSNVGEKIHAQIDAGEDKLISQLAAEFERYGDAAQDYFHRRAQVFAIIVAVVVAFVVNVDSVMLFRSLASSNQLSQSVVNQIEVEQRAAQFYASKAVSSPESQTLQQARDQVQILTRSDIEQLSKLSLPIGHEFFPYCSENLQDQASLNSEESGFSKRSLDSRCDIFHSAGNAGVEKNIVTAVQTKEFWKWFCSTFLAGLLIGLGAPFWFKAYRFLADFIPGVNRGPKTDTRQKSGNEGSMLESSNNSASDAVSLNQSQLKSLFKSASGKPLD